MHTLILISKTNSAKKPKKSTFWVFGANAGANFSKSTFSNAKNKDFFSRCFVVWLTAIRVFSKDASATPLHYTRVRGGTLEF